MKIKEVLTKLEQSETDTKYSKEIFNDYEEGKQDKEIKKIKMLIEEIGLLSQIFITTVIRVRSFI